MNAGTEDRDEPNFKLKQYKKFTTAIKLVPTPVSEFGSFIDNLETKIGQLLIIRGFLTKPSHGR